MKEIEIPEGYKARIEGNKVILEPTESEDERIRKEIIQFFKDAANSKTRVVCSNTFAEWATYLEKQKEQKPANVDYISGIRDELLGIENNAKNIDGLTDSQWVAIRAAHRLLGEYLNSNQKPAEWSEEDEKVLKGIVYLLEGYIFPNSLYGEDARYGISWLKSLHPQPHKDMPDVIAEVTKDKESAIKFLKGAGIMDDNGKLAEMYRSEQKPTESSIYPSSLDEAIQLYYDTYGDGKGGFVHLSLPKFEDIVKEFVKDYRQKPAEWNDEDEYVINKVLNWAEIVNPTSSIFEKLPKKQFIERLKSLRPQPKQGWSEEDEKFINNLCNLLASLTKNNRIGCYYAPDIINKIKSLRPCGNPENPNSHWSEEDEKMLHRIICDLREFRNCETDKELISDYEEEITWLKFLRPKPHWRPSEEQMEALNEIINTLAVSENSHESNYLFNMLKGLRKNLKKL